MFDRQSACCPWRRILGWEVVAIALTNVVMMPEGCPLVVAQVFPDATLGTEASQVSPNQLVNGGPGDRIDGGALRGVNLFHSFSQFSIGAGQRVYFANPAGVQNILSRVTGNTRSDIFGTLGVLGNANLFLLNPNGILFGANARLDIAGSFLASTASSFRFADGSEFSAVNPQAAPLLTVNLVPGLQYGTGPAGATITNRGQLFAGQDLTLHADQLDLQGQLGAGRNLTLQASDRVQLRDTDTVPLVVAAGANLRVEGNQAVDILALRHSQSGLFSGGDMVLRSHRPIAGDAHYWSGGNFSITRMDGSPGTLLSPFDPVIRATGDVTLSNYQGSSLHIIAGGQVTASSIIVTTPADTAGTINPSQTPALARFNLSDGTPFVVDGSARPTIDIRAGVDPAAIGTAGITGLNFPNDVFFDDAFQLVFPPATNLPPTSADISIGTILLGGSDGMVLLTNQFQPNLALPGGNINLTATGLLSTIQPGVAIDTGSVGNGGSVTLDARGQITLAGMIDTSTTNGAGGAVRLLANGNMTTRTIDTISQVASPTRFNGGDITLTSRTGSIQVGTQTAPATLAATSGTGNGGAITLDAFGDITTADILATSLAASSNTTAGAVSLTSRNGQINTTAGQIVSLSNRGPGGAIALTAAGDLTVGEIYSIGTTGGAVSLFAGGDLFLRNTARVVSESTGTDPAAQGETLSLAARSITLSDGANVQVAASGATQGGNLTVTARDRLTITGINSAGRGSGIFAITAPIATGNTGNVTINAPEVNVTAGGQLTVRTRGLGNAGSLTITAPIAVTVTGGNIITSVISTQAGVGSRGNAGPLMLQTGRLSIQNGGQIDSSTFGAGNGSNLTIIAPTIDVSGTLPNGTVASNIASNTVAQRGGKGGTVQLITGQLTVRDGAQIGAGTFGGGDGGTLSINATEFVRVVGRGAQAFSALFTAATTGSTGNAGDVIINTPELHVATGGQVSVSTFGAGNAGSLTINAPTAVTVSGDAVPTTVTRITSQAGEGSTGQAGSLTIQTGQLLIQNGGQIDSSTFGAGNGGNVTIMAPTIDVIGLSANGQVISNIASNTVGGGGGSGGTVQLTTAQLTVRDGAQIGAGTFGRGNGGTLWVNATELVRVVGRGLQGSSTLFTAAGAGSTGNAGNLTITAPQVQVTDQGSISTATSGSGNGGNLAIASRQLTIQNNADLVAASFSSGRAGGLAIATETLTIERGARVNVSNEGTGDAGDLTIRAGTITLRDRAALIAETASGQGGNINLQVGDLLLLRNNSLISTTAGTERAGGDGGNITIDAPFLVGVLAENSDIRANAFTGRGGKVEITTQGIFGLQFQLRDTPRSDITASSEFGLNGDVILNILSIDPSQGLTALPVDLVDATGLIAQQCPGSSDASQPSSFVVTGRGGLPPTPTEPLSSDAIWQDWQLYQNGMQQNGINSRSAQVGRSRSDNNQLSTMPAIVEAGNWVRDSDGSVALVAQLPASVVVNLGQWHPDRPLVPRDQCGY